LRPTLKNSFLERLFLRLLYLTPVGYFLDSIHILEGRKTPGLYVEFSRYSPFRAFITKNPTIDERINWSINGIILLAQGGFVLVKIWENTRGLFASLSLIFVIVSFVFGLVSLISALFPKIRWNKYF
jgi:hypothetical protein